MMTDAGTPLPKVWQPYVDKLEQRIKELEADIKKYDYQLNQEIDDHIAAVKRGRELQERLDALETWAFQFPEDFKKRTAYPLEQKDESV